jgi:hypothetical protein
VVSQPCPFPASTNVAGLMSNCARPVSRSRSDVDPFLRTFLVAAGAHLLGHPPALLHDLDLRACVQPEERFVADLRAVQDRVRAKP